MLRESQAREGIMRRWLVVVTVTLALAACSKGKDSPLTPEKVAENQRWEKYLSASEKEANILIAAKYGITQNTADDIISTYLQRHDLVSTFTNNTSGKVPSPAYAATIVELSGKYSIPPDKVASIILDSKIWTALDAHQ